MDNYYCLLVLLCLKMSLTFFYTSNSNGLMVVWGEQMAPGVTTFFFNIFISVPWNWFWRWQKGVTVLERNSMRLNTLQKKIPWHVCGGTIIRLCLFFFWIDAKGDFGRTMIFLPPIGLVILIYSNNADKNFFFIWLVEKSSVMYYGSHWCIKKLAMFLYGVPYLEEYI